MAKMAAILSFKQAKGYEVKKLKVPGEVKFITTPAGFARAFFQDYRESVLSEVLFSFPLQNN